MAKLELPRSERKPSCRVVMSACVVAAGQTSSWEATHPLYWSGADDQVRKSETLCRREIMQDDDQMPASSRHGHMSAGCEDEADFDPREYSLMLLLERLESLEEEMEELGVTSLAMVRQRIAELHHQLGDE